MRKLALDLGTRTCGFAISDEMCIIASPLENFRFSENAFNLVIEKVFLYLSEYKTIDKIILGYPLRMNGTKSERTVMVEEFKIKLENHLSESNFNIPVILINEQNSTKNAESVLIEAGMTRQKRKLHKDKLAAVLILEDFLNYYF
ncbi:Holliday junction resolvase RuvX [Mycoplasmopsis pullorum]|uniref:Putative pre-16S rRNA nuclease n=1 Tax=Mycoplasmopsis pullorum TaxID=48003 RepID=A0A1L4FSE7_9BACT|nr:Holliday junction resolvase RuvX [Mycoplasmopsis pullorum]APJ38528.1 Holliday junction resolvase [Mycoplasmopsis pullorum]TNK81817.1 Holliday junction resolvase RuvX [Mycoplasmopsis pullorum]TNK83410.1 Holliday junction resolvase RuvX [Mycoplasmopsis pullorum]TNK85065.1 Holliday junction resolvase RuvX [Mycoplasmopsis pullorum]TNK85639.1 Holliday junction resolvase RuvX [Mycoplasmopsis pullorum]